MATPWLSEFKQYKTIFEACSDYTGLHLAKLGTTGEADEIAQTAITQPLVFAHNIALYEIFINEFCEPPAIAGGHSLGEWSALCAANVYNLEMCAKLVSARATAMSSDELQDIGALAACIRGEAEALCIQAQSEHQDLWVANLNSPDQVVVGGSTDGLAYGQEHAKEFGIRKYIPLAVSAPFHTPLMQPAVEQFADNLADATATEADFDVYANCTSQRHSIAQINTLMARQIAEPVNFRGQLASMRTAMDTDNPKWVEIGPKPVVGTFVKQTLREDCVSFATPADLRLSLLAA